MLWVVAATVEVVVHVELFDIGATSEWMGGSGTLLVRDGGARS